MWATRSERRVVHISTALPTAEWQSGAPWMNTCQEMAAREFVIPICRGDLVRVPKIWGQFECRCPSPVTVSIVSKNCH